MATIDNLKNREDEINFTFDYLRRLALDGLKNHKSTKMSFSIEFENGCAPVITHSITELLIRE